MYWKKPTTQKDFISGYFYHKLCDWSVCPRYEQKFDVRNIKENDLVFLNIDYIEDFVNYLSLNTPKNKFILVTQNSDRDFTETMFNSVEKFTNKILAVNSSVSSSKMIKTPLGFNDHSTEVLENEDFSFNHKENFVYVNFQTHHQPDRPKCLNYFKQFDWVEVENGLLPLKDYYNKLRTFKYSICPRGTGVDTHRIYESLLYGVIPLVKTSFLDDLYKDLPVIIVNEWEDVNYDFLYENYETNLSNYFDWFNNNPNWFKSDYWIKK